MASNTEKGNKGERDVVNLVKCPNCKRELNLLPTGFPIFDVQCSGCEFRAQVKSSESRPKDKVFGATWRIMDGRLRAGAMPPPLIMNFYWEDKKEKKKCQEIRFYPFVPRKNLHPHMSHRSDGRSIHMFWYEGLNDLPYFVVYES